MQLNYSFCDLAISFKDFAGALNDFENVRKQKRKLPLLGEMCPFASFSSSVDILTCTRVNGVKKKKKNLHFIL